MAIAFQCEQCGKQFQVDDSMAGKRCKCKQCGHIFPIPGGRPAARPASASASAPVARPSASATKPARPAPSAPRVDPYAVDDEPVPLRRTPSADRDEEFLAPVNRPAVKKVKKTPRRSDGSEMEALSNITVWGLLAGIVLYVIIGILAVLKSTTGLTITIPILIILILVMSLIGGIAALVVAFKEDVVQGLLYLFVPFYALYYLITRWEAMKRPFLLSLSASGLMMVGAIAFPIAVAARVAAEQQNMANGQLAPQQPQNPMENPFGPGPVARHQPNPAFQPAAVQPEPAAAPAPENVDVSQHEPLVKEYIASINETADVCAKVVDQQTARQNMGQAMFSPHKIQSVETRARFVPKPSEAQLTRLEQQHSGDLQTAFARLVGEINRIYSLQGKPAPEMKVFPTIRALFAGSRPQPAFANRARPNMPGAPAAQPPQQAGSYDEQALIDLKSPDLQQRKGALRSLMNAPPTEKRVEVARAVEPLLKDPDGFTRADAAKTLGVWGGPENTPALVATLKDPAFNVRWAVLDALKLLKDPTSATGVAAFITTNDRGKACDVLREIGPEAEDAALPYLQHGDGFVRMDVCKLLKDIGTAKSVPMLRTIALRKSGLDSMAAVDALNQLAFRGINVNTPTTTAKKKSRGVEPPLYNTEKKRRASDPIAID